MTPSEIVSKINDITRTVTNEAGSANLPGKENGPQDAYRHLLLSAELTRVFGEDVAHALLSAHEADNLVREGQPAINTEMDVGNNITGQEIGKNAQSWDEVVREARLKMDQSMNGAGASDPNGSANWMDPQAWSDADSTNTTPYSERNWPTNPSFPDGPAWPNSSYPLPPNLSSPPLDGNILQGIENVGRILTGHSCLHYWLSLSSTLDMVT